MALSGTTLASRIYTLVDKKVNDYSMFDMLSMEISSYVSANANAVGWYNGYIPDKGPVSYGASGVLTISTAALTLATDTENFATWLNRSLQSTLTWVVTALSPLAGVSPGIVAIPFTPIGSEDLATIEDPYKVWEKVSNSLILSIQQGVIPPTPAVGADGSTGVITWSNIL